MPKKVDPAARRGEVTDALFRVVVRDGLQRASLRAVADEANLNIGSLRHYFASHRELMRFAMGSMLDRVAGRLRHRIEEAEAMGGPGRLTCTQQRQFRAGLLAELLPLDEERRAEVTVFLEFTAAARTNPDLADLAHESAASTRILVRRVLTGMSDNGALRCNLDIDTETERLAALLDGLGQQGVLHPDLMAADHCMKALRAHLADLEPAVREDG